MGHTRQCLECGGVGGDDGSARRPRGGGDLKVVCAPGLAGAAYVREERCVVARDLQVEVDDLDSLEDALDQFAATVAVTVRGELNSNQQLRRSHGADRNVRVGGKHVTRSGSPSFEGDQRAGVEDQPIHGSSVGAGPTRRRISARSASHVSSAGCSRRNSRSPPRVARLAGAIVAMGRPRRTTVNVSPRCSTASSMSAKRFDASVAEISATIRLSDILTTESIGTLPHQAKTKQGGIVPSVALGGRAACRPWGRSKRSDLETSSAP